MEINLNKQQWVTWLLDKTLLNYNQELQIIWIYKEIQVTINNIKNKHQCQLWIHIYNYKAKWTLINFKLNIKLNQTKGLSHQLKHKTSYRHTIKKNHYLYKLFNVNTKKIVNLYQIFIIKIKKLWWKKLNLYYIL